MFARSTVTASSRIAPDGRVTFEPLPDSAFEMHADLVLLAMGFVGSREEPLARPISTSASATAAPSWRDEQWMTSVPGVFAAGDMQRGQSLIVWAIDDGRRAAAAIDAYLARPAGAQLADPAASQAKKHQTARAFE